MKKIFTVLCVLSMTMAMHASFHLTIDKWVGDEQVSVEIVKDTTIVVTEFEYDEDMEEATMGVEGTMYSDDTDSIMVTITRSATDVVDQLCAGGNCVPGNGELKQEIAFKVGEMESMRSWFTHYTALEAGKVTINYAFNDGTNPVINLTIVYDYKGTAVDDVIVRPTDNAIYNLLGQRMPSNDLSELPAGIYIINGKKYIKQ
jgi:hypothetical protein